MTVIIKCNGIATNAATGCITAEARDRRARPREGDRVFVWTSETRGGEGLLARGIISAVGPGSRGATRLTINPDGRSVLRALGKGDLLPHRDAPIGQPIASLAAKLYRQAHTKIAPLDTTEERYLDERFN